MAKQRSLILQATDGYGDEVKKSFANVNTAATMNDIDTSMRALNGLTTNTYYDTTVVETESVNDWLEENEEG